MIANAGLTDTGSPKFPELASEFPHTPKEQIDHYLQELQAKKDDWLRVSPAERIVILNEINRDLQRLADRWIAASIHAKNVLPESIGEGEEWMSLMMVLRAVRLLRQSLREIKRQGQPRIPGGIFQKNEGQVAARVFPGNWFEKILYPQISGEVWMKPGISENEVIEKQARAYKDKSPVGKVSLVLAAGNMAVISVMDSLSKLFVENQVVVLKTNPVNAYLGPIFDQVFQALVRRGFLRIVYGGAEEGTYLCYHENVDEIHLTGSDKTFEAIVFGPGQEGKKRKQEGKPILKKRFTAELGNITPVIVVPGPWTQKDMQRQALQLASWLTVNAGCNCLTPRVIVQHKNWDKRDDFIQVISNVLAKIETRNAYYPGAAARHNRFMAAHSDALQLGNPQAGHLPWSLIPRVDPDCEDDICFNQEAFCGLFCETGLEADNVSGFIEKAVEFANQRFWGTLTATILVHPKSLRDRRVAAAVEQAIADLHYGSVSVNLRAEYAYLIMKTPWGGFPVHDMFDIQSGVGVVNNLLMFHKPQKSVIRGPFRQWPNPFVATSKRLHKLGRKMASFEASPTLWKLPGIFWDALRS